MTLQTETIDNSVETNDAIEIPTGEDTRLLVDAWDNGRRVLVRVRSQYRDRLDWRIAHNGLLLDTATARQLSPAIDTIVACIDAAPEDPTPDDEQRELSRMP